MTQDNSPTVNQPLRGIRVIEFEGLGVIPYVGMLLADLGASVVRVARVAAPDVLSDGPARIDPAFDFTSRGRLVWRLNLKKDDRAELQGLLRCADVLLEGYRPGVMERLSLGPTDVFALNRRIIYSRLTGLPRRLDSSRAPVHDINALALSGALHALGSPGRAPRLPMNFVADYGGGSLVGVAVCAALSQRSGPMEDRILDLSILGTLSTLLTGYFGLTGQGTIQSPGTSYLDGAAPFYGTYGTSDGRFLAVGAMEAHFYANFLSALGLTIGDVGEQNDAACWPSGRAVIAKVIESRTLEHWIARYRDVEACVSPVLTPSEAAVQDPMRSTLADVGSWVQPLPLLGGAMPTPAKYVSEEEISHVRSQWTRQLSQ
ncbi:MULTISPECIES: CaiB/BaiF CoA-transferase family protein [unclassified Microbacterium]|uniref:CoA transferase n=1 Tax=unclassified Microbacterium TaxID=2609290 RepID=UPI00214A9A1D|nr:MULTISPECIES: CaiB/BaiF CoA-transferase family protein [unclassified Microbacterium]MCR2811312.1 CoA transferase [Microbacterium sp. zg.B185]WIM19469.1 CaiB/BaiF CoA-transferase family protein [Microbacterium sp. zg-B185]